MIFFHAEHLHKNSCISVFLSHCSGFGGKMVTPSWIYMRDVLLDQMGRVLPEAQCVPMITAAWSRKFLMDSSKNRRYGQGWRYSDGLGSGTHAWVCCAHSQPARKSARGAKNLTEMQMKVYKIKNNFFKKWRHLNKTLQQKFSSKSVTAFYAGTKKKGMEPFKHLLGKFCS